MQADEGARMPSSPCIGGVLDPLSQAKVPLPTSSRKSRRTPPK
jgi:hypothetical protein